MVLIDSPTDLIATASRQTPKMDTMMERFGSPYEEPSAGILGQQTQFSSNDYDYQSSWQDVYLKGAYDQRVEDLEKFAQEKNFWSSTSPSYTDNEDIQYLEGGSGETGRRQRFRPFGRPLRRRPIANRRKEAGNYDKEDGFYDYENPLSISNIWSSSSTTSEDVLPHKVYPPGYIRPEDRPNQDENGLTRRVANAIFNPLSETIFTIIAIPLIIAAVYWLFVVNGPTPVVKARIEEFGQNLEEEVNKFDWEKFDLTKYEWSKILLQALKVFVPVTPKE